MISCSLKNKSSNNEFSETMTGDKMMIAFFDENKADFERLVNNLQEDSVAYFFGGNSRTIGGDDLQLSDERLAEYKSLFDKLSVKSVARGNTLNFNTIVLYTVESRSKDSTVNKGYEYRIDASKKYADWVETSDDLLQTASSYDKGTFIFRPITKHWNLFLLIQ